MTRLSPLVAGATLCCAAALAGCGGSPAAIPQPAPVPVATTEDRAAFLVRLGNDTLAGEQFTRTPTSLSGNSAVRSPATLLRSYSAALRPDGTVERFELTARRAVLTVPPQKVTMTFGGDAVAVVTQIGDSTPRTSRVAVTGPAFPYVGNAYALFELATGYATRTAHAAVGDTVRVTMVATIGRLLPATVTRSSTDSMLISLSGDAPYRARVDSAGRILGLFGTPTQQVTVTRVPSVDIQDLSAAQPIGTLSPTDTVRWTPGRDTVSVVYSRPSKRGRTILGGIVPYDQVWRTGANAATMLTTTTDLLIASTRVPRGSYTLWTLPSRTGWKLIVNRQTKQWGTEYDPSRDLARIDVASAPLASQPVEQFTIALEPSGARNGRLRLMWDDFEVSTPVVAR